MSSRKGFTLIELLVVIAIVAVLAVVVVLVLNPVALLQQGRDSNRLSDMATIQSAINYYLTDQPGISIGSANTVYVSIPDPTATSTAGDQCQGLGLPALPAIYSYHCAASSTFRMANATGWIPVNLGAVSVGSPLGQLPIDPTNSTSSRLYYTYVTNGSQYEVTAAMESAKYKFGGASDVITGDGGTLASVVEKGSRLGLEPLDYGDSSLVGFWTFEEGSSSVAYDYSGTNATGSWNGAATGTAGYYSIGKIGSWAGAFDATSTYVQIPDSVPVRVGSPSFSFFAWINPTTLSSCSSFLCIIFNKENTYEWAIDNGGNIGWAIRNTSPGWNWISAGGSVPVGAWTNIAVVYNGSQILTYKNGVLINTVSGSGSVDNTTYQNALRIGARGAPGAASSFFPGYLDDVRIYNRALSAAEITALYNGGK